MVTCKITGLDALQKKLEHELPAKARLALRIALAAGASTVREEMVADAPVEEGGENQGFLEDHLVIKTTIRRNELSGTAKVGPSQAVYPGSEKQGFKLRIGGKEISVNAKLTAARVGRFLQFGTSKMSARPFMTQAWEASKGRALERIIQKLKETLKLS